MPTQQGTKVAISSIASTVTIDGGQRYRIDAGETEYPADTYEKFETKFPAAAQLDTQLYGHLSCVSVNLM